MPVLVSGALQSWDHAQSILAAQGLPQNVLYDSAGWTTSTDPARVLAVVGPRRLLFGAGGLAATALAADQLEQALRQAGTADGVIADVMWRNSAELLSLEPFAS